MDKIAKLLKRLSLNERERLEKTLTLLLSGKAAGLDVKKLKGQDDIYRLRIGALRVIFQRLKGDMRILEISRRDDNTYSGY